MDESNHNGSISKMSNLPKTEYTILVTGSGGQLGQELIRLQRNGVRIIGMDRNELDITNAEQCMAIVTQVKPDVVIHAAAYTAVDRAESDREAAWLVNVEGTRNVALAAEAVGAKLCYVSTDYVFDGKGSEPYSEYDPTAPQTVYGHTKLEGERAAAENSSRLFIVRTSWVYGRYGDNFVRTMLRLAKEKQELAVVDDQVGAPTYTYDLATFLVKLVLSEKVGVYHASNSGICTWFEFAQAIFEGADVKGITLKPCATDDFPRPASRPSYSVLGNTALVDAGFEPLRDWHAALSEFLSDLGENN
jgi:dTDP-4-dehydrorhamnose reductase